MRVQLALMALSSAVSCGTEGTARSPGSRCGDGVCTDDETPTTCAADCGGATPECSATVDTCSGETICIAGICEAAFPRVYQITNVVASMPTRNPNTGEEWDIGGGAPDLYVGDVSGTPISAVVADEFSATFVGPFEVQLIAGQAFRLDLWDEDVTTPDYAFGCGQNPISPSLLRSRNFGCAANGATLSATIEPK